MEEAEWEVRIVRGDNDLASSFSCADKTSDDDSDAAGIGDGASGYAVAAKDEESEVDCLTGEGSPRPGSPPSRLPPSGVPPRSAATSRRSRLLVPAVRARCSTWAPRAIGERGSRRR